MILQVKLPAALPEYVDHQGNVVMVDYLTAEQWEALCRADGIDVDELHKRKRSLILKDNPIEDCCRQPLRCDVPRHG